MQNREAAPESSRVVRIMAAVAGALVLIALTARGAHAWRQQAAGAPFGDVGYAVAVDASGNAIAVGRVNGRLTAFKYAAADGLQLWSYDGGDGTYGADVAIDGNGDAIVVGSTGSSPAKFTIIKLDGASGGEIWRTEADDDGFSSYVVAVDSMGNAIAGGTIGPYPNYQLFVVKLDGATGVESWRLEDPMDDSYNAGVHAIAIDAADDVIFVGTLDPGAQRYLIARKLDGSTGSQIWNNTLGNGSFYGAGYDQVHGGIVLDGAGDVYLTDSIDDGALDEDMLVAKLNGVSGTEVWRHHVAGDVYTFEAGVALALTSTGDVVAAGRVHNHAFVTRLFGSNGGTVWEKAVGHPYGFLPNHSVGAVGVDAADDVIVAGSLDRGPSCEQFTVFKMSGASGNEIWRRALDGADSSPCPFGGVYKMVLDSAANAVATGVRPGFVTARFDSVDGVVGPVTGKKLLVKDRAGDPTGRRIVGLLGDRSIGTSGVSTPGDAVASGAKIQLVNPATAESVTFTLPPGTAYWKGLGNPAGSKGYRYVDAAGANGPCKVLIAKPGRLIKFVCLGTNGSIPFSLDEAGQASLTAVVQLGSAQPQCTTFGGTIRRNAGTNNPGPAGTFLAINAEPGVGTCPEP